MCIPLVLLMLVGDDDDDDGDDDDVCQGQYCRVQVWPPGLGGYNILWSLWAISLASFNLSEDFV